MIKAGKACISLLLLLGLAGVFYLNAALFRHHPIVLVQGKPLDADVLAQLHHLKPQLHTGAADEMQALYPEGFVFLNALYSLAWSEVGAAVPQGTTVHREAITESRWAVREIASNQARSVFDSELPLPYGAFYNGWLGYALGKHLQTLPPKDRRTPEAALFQRTCAQIAQAVADSLSPYPESYSGAVWPADATVCLAALALHDQLYSPLYQATIQSWLRRVSLRTDSLGFIPHEAAPRTGQVRAAARGSSQSLILSLLIDIDPKFGQRYFTRYLYYFADQRLGLPGIREYPKGSAGTGDIDSGPVIWDIGGAASVVGRRTARQYGNAELAAGLRNSIEAFGMAGTTNAKRSYLFGKLPIADAFIAWSNSSALQKPLEAGTNWRWRFQLLSLAGSCVLLGLLRVLWRKPQKAR